ncbi:MAG: hypothetical protein HQK72_14990 [Desulfamplus sp.]|nr:hypothetical protein [Desulfamplus sp.]
MLEEETNSAVIGVTSTTTKIKTNMKEDLKPREDIEIIEQYKEDAVIYGYKGVFAYDAWLEINELYFFNSLKPIQIIWGITNYSRSLGNINKNRMMLHDSIYCPVSEIVWDTDKKMFGKKYTYDVILHEMIHQHAHQFQPQYKEKPFYTSHNNPFWCSEVVRIGELLGYELKAVPQKLRRIEGKVKTFIPDGHLTRKELASFPGCIRPAGYYLNK